MFIEGEWIEIGSVVFTYDNRGNAIQEDMTGDDGIYKSITEYDENNMPVSVITTVKNGSEWLNENKRSYKYDPVLTSYHIERLGFDWIDGTWIRNYLCETNSIVRNPDGNITEIIKSLPIGGENMLAAYKSAWNYDEISGKANEFYYYGNYNTGNLPSWQLYNDTDYRNIEWQNSDGQMTGSSMIEFTQGANRVKSCDVYYQNEIDGHIFVEYTEDNNLDYYYKETYADPTVIGLTYRYETIDDNGSFRKIYSEYFDVNGNPTEDPNYSIIQENIMDNYGNMILETITESQGGIDEIVSKTKIEYDYDSNGNIKEYTQSFYDTEINDFIPDNKAVFGEYTEIMASVDNIMNDQTNPGNVYNIQGIFIRRIDSTEDLKELPSGLYIVDGRKYNVR